MAGLQIVFGILCGIIVLAAMILVTLRLYFRCKQRFADNGILPEFIIVAGVIAVSFVMKFAIGIMAIETCSDPAVNGMNGVARLYEALYSTIGGLTFEGIAVETASDIVNALVMCLYSGTSLYAGVMILCVITAKASYEMYSYAALRLMRKKADKDFYIFTAVNDITLQLASSIRQKYVAEQKESVILFSGKGLSKFDAKDPMCQRVVANGFYYWSYAEITEQQEISIAHRLHLSNHNFKNFDKRFAMFAFDVNAQDYPDEENNLETVFSDIRARIGQGADDLRIEYYVLTKRELNDQAYQRQMDDFAAQYAADQIARVQNAPFETLPKDVAAILSEKDESEDESGKGKEAEKRKKLQDYFRNEFVCHTQFALVNESALTAQAMVNSAEFLAWQRNNIRNQNKTTISDPTKVWLLGFGGVGQSALAHLYIHTSQIQPVRLADGTLWHRTKPFVAEVFDSDTDDYAGLYAKNHPMAICLDGEKLYDSSVSDPAKVKQVREYVLDQYVRLLKNYDTEVRGTIRYLEDKANCAAEEALLRQAGLLDPYGKVLSEQARAYLNGLHDEQAKQKLINAVDKLNTDETYEELCLYRELSAQFADMQFDDTCVYDKDDAYYEAIGSNVDTAMRRMIGLGQDVPNIIFHRQTCTGLEFMEQLDAATGEIANPQRKMVYHEAQLRRLCRSTTAAPDVIVFALGDDYRNIECANACIHDFISEKYTSTIREQFLFVHVRNKQNCCLLDLPDPNSVHAQKLHVVTVGALQDILTYDSILNTEQAQKYAYGYNCLYLLTNELFHDDGKIDTSDPEEKACSDTYGRMISQPLCAYGSPVNDETKTELYIATFVSALRHFAMNEKLEPSDLPVQEALRKILLRMQQKFIENRKNKSDWLHSSVFHKESNRQAAIFMPFMREHIDMLEKEDYTVRQVNGMLVYLEHLRWVRTYCAYGWNIGKRNDALRKHDCLVPDQFVIRRKLLFDLINSVWARTNAEETKPSSESYGG